MEMMMSEEINEKHGMSISAEPDALATVSRLCENVQKNLDFIYDEDQDAYGRVLEYIASRFPFMS